MRNSRWFSAGHTALLVLTAVSLAGCGDGAVADGVVEVPAPVPTRLVAVAPIEFSGVVGSELSPGPAVRVEDQNGNPLAGVAVVFQKPGDNSGIPVTVASDPNGIAQLGTWRLGKQAGTQTMTARLGLLSVAFSAAALPGPAATLAVVAGDNQTGLPGYALRVPLRVRITDSFGNSIAGAEVTFAVVTGAGTITPALATTSEYGQVDALWTLGVSGANSVTASAPGLPVLRFTAVAIPLAPATYSLQSAHTASQVFLAADGSFTMYVNDIKGSGTYTAEGTTIWFKYAPGFWKLMASEMDTYLMDQGATSEEEIGEITDGKTLTFVRCHSDECWRGFWSYSRVLP